LHFNQRRPYDRGPVKRRTIAETFEALRRAGRIALMPFIPAGYPDLETTAALIPALEAGGANLIEIGFPFSDPIADGPIVQEAFAHALAKKVKVADVFATVASARGKSSIPLLGMLSYSIVYRHGVERFVAEAKAAGLDGLILPDLPPPEAQQVCDRVWAGGLETVLLVAPTTTPERRRQIAQLSTGFIYYLSVTGITGERDQLPADLAANVRALKQLTDRPVCVGFGISQPRHVKQLVGTADGAIVGSFLVRKIKAELGHSRETLAAAIRNEVAGLSKSTG
jgi:tryptophan synthase alpha chain